MSTWKEYDDAVNRMTDHYLLVICVGVALASVGRLWVFFVLYILAVGINVLLKYIARRSIKQQEDDVITMLRDLTARRTKNE